MKWLTWIVGPALLSVALVASGAESPPTLPLPPPAAKVVVPSVVPLLDAPCWNLRLWAAEYLGDELAKLDEKGKLSAEVAMAVSALSRRLDDGVPAIRRSAANALGQIGGPAAVAAPALAARLQDPTATVRAAAATALAQIGPAASAAIPQARALLMDPQWDVRRRAADALGGIGPAAKDAIEELRALLADEEPLVRVAAATALTKVSSAKLDTVVPSVATLLRDPHPGVRAAVADLLGNLLSASQGGSVSPRDAERIRRVATQFIPALTEVLGDCDYRVRMAAVQALGQAGPLATEALPAVTLLLRDGIPDVRSAAVAALLRIKGQ